MPMELRHLRYFVAVAEELNFARAAARLRIAPPALSVQIRKLELEIGTDLLARDGRGSKLTDAGRIFLVQARKSIADAGLGVALARRAAKGEIGHMSIGYNTPSEFGIFPKVIPAFKKKSPDVDLRFHNLTTPQIIEALRRDEVDLGFVWLPIPPDEFQMQPLAEHPLIVVVPAEHPLASAKFVSIEQLSNEPLVFFRRALEPFAFHQIEQLFVESGSIMNIACELDTTPQMINFVAIGIGCTILPDYVRGIIRDGVVYKTLRPGVVKTLAIVKKKDTVGIADHFFKFVLDELRIKRRVS
jgi:DNA-binding transcriptional LysR family regulator